MPEAFNEPVIFMVYADNVLEIVLEAPLIIRGPETYKPVLVAFTATKLLIVVLAPFKIVAPET